jgi:putative endonuclease
VVVATVNGAARAGLGAAGEALVAAWYRRAGYDVVDRNWRCRDGELDLVLTRAGTVVFCEVKTRASSAYGAPYEAVTTRKQRRLRKLALLWLHAHSGRWRALRFDVGSVVRDERGRLLVDVLEDAF